MKITVENLGALRQATFELGDLTIICGGNNTGKTYATYALYGFLQFWREAYSIHVDREVVNELLDTGKVTLDLDDYARRRNEILASACNSYIRQLPSVFGAPEHRFSETKFKVVLDRPKDQPMASFRRAFQTRKKELFEIEHLSDSNQLQVSLLVEKGTVDIPDQVYRRAIGNALQEVLFGPVVPHPFIVSAERTGAAIFRKELNFARNRLVEQMGSMERELDAYELLDKVYSDYALPVRRNVDFTRQLESLVKNESFILRDHSDILKRFSDIIGGEYHVTRRDELCFVPSASRQLKLSMDESSSAARSLLDIGFYLRHVASVGDLLIIDEPELNLHPENQRRVARLIAQLINIGLRVFITTHSDYIVKELNTLIMLNKRTATHQRLMDEFGYLESELLNPERTRVYIAEKAPMLLEGMQRKGKYQTLVAADIDKDLGIEARSFDTTIDEMNAIQEAIMFASEEEIDA